MKAIINGQATGGLRYSAGSDKVINIIVLDDAGAPVNLTGDTVGVEIYANSDRSDTATDVAGVLTDATAGHVNADFADTLALTAGDYYLWVKHTAAGGNITYANDAGFNLKVV